VTEIEALIGREYEVGREYELGRAYLESGFKGPFAIDFRAGRIRLGRGLAEMFALDVEELRRGIDLDLADRLHHPDDLAWVKEIRRQPAGILGLKISEFRVIDRHDDVRWIQTRSRVHHDRFGLPAVERGITFDVTDLKREQVFTHTSPAANPSHALDTIADGIMSAYNTAVELGHDEIRERLMELLMKTRGLISRKTGYESDLRH
jgi:hypothetical protein